MLSTCWIAILLLSDPTVTDSCSLLNHIITQYAYPGLKELIAVGIVSMAMSTADSEINATAVLIMNDFPKPLKVIDVDKKILLVSVRLASLVLGLFGLALALSRENLLTMLLFASSFYMPIVTVPFLLAIFGFRSKPRSMLIGMTTGFITVISWSVFLDNESSIVPGVIANLVFFMGSHYLLKEEGGWGWY